jgi:hypothetical protein
MIPLQLDILSFFYFLYVPERERRVCGKAAATSTSSGAVGRHATAAAAAAAGRTAAAAGHATSFSGRGFSGLALDAPKPAPRAGGA